MVAFRNLAFRARGGLCHGQVDSLACVCVCGLRVCCFVICCASVLGRSRKCAFLRAVQAGGVRAGSLQHIAAKWIGRARARGVAACARARQTPEPFQVERLEWGWPRLVCRFGECARGRCLSRPPVKRPARASWRDQRAILASRWPSPRWRQGGARRAYCYSKLVAELFF